MRRLVIVVVCLLALFTLINAYTRESTATSQERLQNEAPEADSAIGRASGYLLFPV